MVPLERDILSESVSQQLDALLLQLIIMIIIITAATKRKYVEKENTPWHNWTKEEINCNKDRQLSHCWVLTKVAEDKDEMKSWQRLYRKNEKFRRLFHEKDNITYFIRMFQPPTGSAFTEGYEN